MNKITVVSPANIAFVKYWGRRNNELILPHNSSVSMNMSGCLTTTSCEWGEFESDTIRIKFSGKEECEATGISREKILKVVNRIRTKLNTSMKVKLVTENNFPESTGIASSASGFSALTKALYESYGVNLSEKDLSIETRLSGSGSACRSIPDGFVVWEKGNKADGSDSYAYSVAPPDHWKLCDLVCIVDDENKKISSGEGHVLATNEYMKARLTKIDKRIEDAVMAIEKKDLEKLGVVTEIEAMSLHTVCMMSEPPIFYLNGATFMIMEEIRNMRSQGIMAYYTMDAGANVHVIFEKENEEIIKKKLGRLDFVKFMIVNYPCIGAKKI